MNKIEKFVLTCICIVFIWVISMMFFAACTSNFCYSHGYASYSVTPTYESYCKNLELGTSIIINTKDVK